jgi:adenylate cyclase
MKGTLGTLAIVVLVAAALELFALRWLRPIENRVLDAFVRMQAAQLAPDPDIVLVEIDEKSLAAMQPDAGRFPWPREVYADLIAGLAAQKPRAIVFDIMFSEPDRFRPQSDRAFVEAVQHHKNIWFPMLRLDASLDSRGERAADLAWALGLVRDRNADPNARIAVVPPLALPPELWRAGTINYLEDADGVGRRYAIRTSVRGWQLFSLPARLALDLGWPLPDREDMMLAWRGGSGAFPRVSFSDLYEDFNRSQRRRPANEFSGKIVIIGASAAGLGDLRVTPLSSVQPGAEILGTAIENLKNGRSMSRVPPELPAAAALLLVALLYWAFRRNIDAARSGAALAAASIAIAGGAWAAAGRLLLAPVVAPLAAGWLFYFGAALAAYLRERRARAEAIAMFSRFVNPHVVKTLVEAGGLPPGQSREVTLLFSDIRGFTSLSETRKPEEVVALLNRYFSIQVEVIFSHGGSLDKFIGDAIMAFWGAPLEEPAHARRAVACALDMAAALERFKEEAGEVARNFDVGIGIHSGPAVVGLIGSEKRREYTAIGDTVNLASRIEGLTKDAGRRILVSADTVRLCGDAFDFVSCGSYKVKGRTQEVELFAPKRKP